MRRRRQNGEHAAGLIAHSASVRELAAALDRVTAVVTARLDAHAVAIEALRGLAAEHAGMIDAAHARLDASNRVHSASVAPIAPADVEPEGRPETAGAEPEPEPGARIEAERWYRPAFCEACGVSFEHDYMAGGSPDCPSCGDADDVRLGPATAVLPRRPSGGGKPV